MRPDEIEKLSFEIIDTEAGDHAFSPMEWRIVRRMIHTSADFDYMKTVRIHPQAIAAGINAIRGGKTIVTDTEMAKSGIRKKNLEQFGGRVECLINDPRVEREAREREETRSKVAAESAIHLMEAGIYAVGNAPTALMEVVNLVRANKAKPALIIGFPVGFVNAAESKEVLMELDYPHISNVGRKGGSNIAASVVNALILLALSDETL